MWNNFARELLIIAQIFIICSICIVGAAHAQNSGRFNHDRFKASCLRECVRKEEKVYCDTYCQCGAAQMGDKAGTDPRWSVKISEAEKSKIAMGCHGAAGLVSVTARCLTGICKAGAKCKAICSCFSGKLKSVGSPAEIGEFFFRFRRNDKVTQEKMGTMYTECNALN